MGNAFVIKLSVFVILFAFATPHFPLRAEARHKHVHHKNYHHRRVKPSPVTLPPSPPPQITPSPTPTPSVEDPPRESAPVPSYPEPAPYIDINNLPPYQIHGCGYPCSDSNDCDAPCTICGANYTCAYDEPYPWPPISSPLSENAPPPVPEVPQYETHGCGFPCTGSKDCDWPCTICNANLTCTYFDIGEPAVLPPPGYEYPPYQIHGCGYPCNDSNDCDAPCTVCGANYTCAYDGCGYQCTDSNDCGWPCTFCNANQTCTFPDIGEPTVLPPPGYEYPPYQVHGCGYQCTDSNDCDWPCTVCGANQTCSYEEPMTLPASAPSQAPELAPSPSSGDDEGVIDAPKPHYDIGVPADITPSGYELPPYQVHGCGHPCFDDNDCDWPCTACGVNKTCRYD
ncbi:unnamed protein product [Amaranthus hypochondriacus]